MGKLAGFVAGSVLACGIMWYQFNNTGEMQLDHRLELLEYMEAELPDWGTHGTLYFQWLDEHHEACAELATETIYRRKRTRIVFHEDWYRAKMLSAMAFSASEAGYSNCAASLVDLSERAGLVEPDHGPSSGPRPPMGLVRPPRP